MVDFWTLNITYGVSRRLLLKHCFWGVDPSWSRKLLVTKGKSSAEECGVSFKPWLVAGSGASARNL